VRQNQGGGVHGASGFLPEFLWLNLSLGFDILPESKSQAQQHAPA